MSQIPPLKTITHKVYLSKLLPELYIATITSCNYAHSADCVAQRCMQVCINSQAATKREDTSPPLNHLPPPGRQPTIRTSYPTTTVRGPVLTSTKGPLPRALTLQLPALREIGPLLSSTRACPRQAPSRLETQHPQ